MEFISRPRTLSFQSKDGPTQYDAHLRSVMVAQIYSRIAHHKRKSSQQRALCRLPQAQGARSVSVPHGVASCAYMPNLFHHEYAWLQRCAPEAVIWQA